MLLESDELEDEEDDDDDKDDNSDDDFPSGFVGAALGVCNSLVVSGSGVNTIVSKSLSGAESDSELPISIGGWSVSMSSIGIVCLGFRRRAVEMFCLAVIGSLSSCISQSSSSVGLFDPMVDGVCGDACDSLCFASTKRKAPISSCASLSLSLVLGVVFAAVDIDMPVGGRPSWARSLSLSSCSELNSNCVPVGS